MAIAGTVGPSKVTGTITFHRCRAAFKTPEHFACTYPEHELGQIWVSLHRLCNHVADQFSRFEPTRGRKPVEMYSGLSG